MSGGINIYLNAAIPAQAGVSQIHSLEDLERALDTFHPRGEYELGYILNTYFTRLHGFNYRVVRDGTKLDIRFGDHPRSSSGVDLLHII